MFKGRVRYGPASFVRITKFLTWVFVIYFSQISERSKSCIMQTIPVKIRSNLEIFELARNRNLSKAEVTPNILWFSLKPRVRD